MFNTRKNKTFNYKPRFSEEENKDKKPTLNTKRETAKKWQQARKTGAGKRKISLPLLLLLLGIIIAILYYLEYKL